MKKLISVVGTTGIGKTKLAIELAKHFQTEILSCDSRQFFKEMPIGTAAPNAAELAEAPHHFIGQLTVTDYYSLGQYEHDAMEKLKDLFAHHDVVIIVGGSMMYEKAVIQGLNDLPEANAENQEKLQTIFEEEGLDGLKNLLKDLDPEYYATVHLENPRRLLRAIDVIWQTGEKYSKLVAEPNEPRFFETIRIGIEAPREVIYERINLRVEKMMEAGLLQEVERLKPFRHLTSLNTVGYTELFKYMDEEWSLDFAVSEIQKNSRRFAKRQLTWYRKEADINWVSYLNSVEESLSLLHKLLIETKK